MNAKTKKTQMASAAKSSAATSGSDEDAKSPKAEQRPEEDNATAKKLISPKSSNFFIYTNVPKVDDNRICPICNEEAPRGETHHPHYGGICCYSCRAFFRRAHQRSKTPKFICKKDGNCQIIAKEKHICKRCRYNKCLSVGMNSKWVLSNEEKRVRFEKFFKRKEEEVSKPGVENSDSPPRSEIPQNGSSVNSKGCKRRLEHEDENNLPVRRRSELSRTSPVMDQSSLGGSQLENKSLQTDANLKSAHQKLPSSFEACVVLEPRSSPPNSKKSQPQPSQLIKLYHSPQKSQDHSINKEDQASSFSGSPQSGLSIVNGHCPGKLGQDVFNEPQHQGFSLAKLQPLNSHREYDLYSVQQQRSSLDSRPYLPRPQYNSLSNHFHGGNANPIVVENQNDGGPWNGPMTSTYVPGQESVRLMLGRDPNGTDSHSIQSKDNFEDQIPNLPQRIHGEIPFSPHQTSSIPFESEKSHAMKQATRQELLKHIEEAKAASHFVINVSGSNFLIQRLPDEQEIDPKSPDNDSRLFHRETEVRLPISNFRPHEDQFYRRQPPDHSPTTILPSANSQHTILGRLSAVLDSFSILSSKSTCDPIKVNDLVANHLRLSPLQKSTLISHSTMIAKMMAEFAMSQFLFMSLDPSDKLTLLKYNAPLYVQYILARYFSAKSGMEQLTWILDGQVPISSIEDFSELQHISFREYNSTVNFIPTSDKSMMYSHHIENIGLFYPFPENCNGLVANLLLYHIDDTIIEKLKEPKRISCIFEDAKELIKAGHKFLDQKQNVEVSGNIRPLITTLTRMKEIFEDCCISSTGSELTPSIIKPFVISYTDTEEFWLRRQFQLFREEFYSVAPPKRYIDELIALQLHSTQVSEDHIQHYIQMSCERMKRVMKIHPEFNNLKSVDQENILNRNVKVGLALTIARLNLYQTGKDQLRAAMGYLGDNCVDWESHYNWTFSLKELKKARLDQSEVHLGKIGPELVDLFNGLFREVSELVPNDELYKIFTLISMLDTNGLPETEGISEIFQMRQTYLKLFQRRLSANGYPPLTYDHFKKILAKLLQFAEIMTAIFSFSTGPEARA